MRLIPLRPIDFGGLIGARLVSSRAVVTTSADAGPGSFRDAIEIANSNPFVRNIVFASVARVDLESTVEYTGPQSLSIDGRGVEIVAGPGDEGSFDLFRSTGDASLNFQNITFRDGLNGIFIPVSSVATGVLSVSLNAVDVTGNSLFGVHVDDQEPDGGGSAASIKFNMSNSLIKGNGIGELDYDGIRVDEGGEGNIDALIANSVIHDNGGDGVELDERGDGSVYANIKTSDFIFNGFFNPADLDDGLDVDEAESGSVVVAARDSSFASNADQGLDLDEAGAGDLSASLARILASSNLDEGIKLDEEDEGSIIYTMQYVQSDSSVNEEGIAINEIGSGDVIIDFLSIQANANKKDGIDIEERDAGSLRFGGTRLETSNSQSGDGLRLQERGYGDLAARVSMLSSRSNDEWGLWVRQETLGADVGFIRGLALDLMGNGSGDAFYSGVTVL